MVSRSEKYQAFLDVQAGEGDGLPDRRGGRRVHPII